MGWPPLQGVWFYLCMPDFVGRGHPIISWVLLARKKKEERGGQPGGPWGKKTGVWFDQKISVSRVLLMEDAEGGRGDSKRGPLWLALS